MIDEKSPYFREREFIVRYSEMDFNKVLKPSAMLNFLQDCATFAADECGFGYKDIVKLNLGWFLLKYHMEFNNYPKNVENLLVKTEARGYNKLFALRDFEMYSADNMELLGRMTSQWTLVDLEEKTMKMPSEIFTFMPKVESRDDDLSFQKIRPLEKIDYTEHFKVRYDDIDVNHHVNNMNYIVWAFEALPKDFKSNHKLKTLDMVYKKEIQFGNEILSEAQLDNNIAKVVVKNKETNDDLCLIQAEFEQY